MLYPYVSSKYFILKIKSVFGEFEFFRLKVPQSPLHLRQLFHILGLLVQHQPNIGSTSRV